MVLLNYSLLPRESELPPSPLEKWIQGSSLSLKELTPPRRISTLLSGTAIWVSSFQDGAITLSQSYPSKVTKMGQKP